MGISSVDLRAVSQEILRKHRGLKHMKSVHVSLQSDFPEANELASAKTVFP